MLKKLALALLAFASLFTLTACGDDNNTPEKTAVTYVQAIYQGDINTAAKLVYLSEKDKSQPGVDNMVKGKLEGFAADAKKKAEQQGGIKTINADPAVYSENKEQAQVSVNILFKKSEKADKPKLRLISTDDGWKVKL